MEPRKIQEIIMELKNHPDYVHMEFFTKGGFRDDVENFFEKMEDEIEYNEQNIERCVSERIDEYKNIVRDFFDYAFEYCSIPEGVGDTLTEWFEQNKNKSNKTSIDQLIYRLNLSMWKKDFLI